jgi:hypothetical protein
MCLNKCAKTLLTTTKITKEGITSNQLRGKYGIKTM